MSEVQNLIVGCGLAGCVLAERIATELKEEVLIIDKRSHIGGNCFDYTDNLGIFIHKYGPHAFHTNDEEVWNYLSNFTKWHQYSHKVRAMINGQDIPLPFNLNSLYSVFSEDKAIQLEEKLVSTFGLDNKVTILDLKQHQDEDLKELANYIYDNVFLGYTIKQWGLKPEDIDESVTARVPVLIGRDDRYFQDKYQAIPADGYAKMFDKMLSNTLINVELETDYKDIKDKISFNRMIYTGPIDEFYDYKYGKLPYRSISLDIKQEDKEYFQPTAQINFPNEFDYTRITEFKHFPDTKSEKTTIAYEYPDEYVFGKNEPYYPIPKEENNLLYEKYKNYAEKETNITFVGRLAEYKYYNMDMVVKRALDQFKELV